MQTIKKEYKITKDIGFIGKRYKTYTIEKKITYDNGETETRIRSFIPLRDGDIEKVNLDELEFQKSITTDEWDELPEEYRKAWIRGTMTEEIKKVGDKCLERIRERKLKEAI